MHEIQQQLLAMYENAQIKSPVDFLEITIQHFQKLVEFDKSILIYGQLELHKLKISTLHLHNLPLDKLHQRLQIKEVDPVLEQAKRYENKAITAVIADFTIECPQLYQHAMEYQQEHALTFCSKKSAITLEQGLVSMYRENKNHPFSPFDLQLCDFFLPHLFIAHQINLKLHSEADLQVRNVMSVIASKDGRLYFLEPAVVELMNKEWPEWTPPLLPKPLLEAFIAGDMYCGKYLMASVRQDQDLLFVKFSELHKSKLTVAEIKVSRLAAKGLSYKEIAKELIVSPSTISNQLQSVYRKLAITNKVELSEKLNEILEGHT